MVENIFAEMYMFISPQSQLSQDIETVAMLLSSPGCELFQGKD